MSEAICPRCGWNVTHLVADALAPNLWLCVGDGRHYLGILIKPDGDPAPVEDGAGNRVWCDFFHRGVT